MADVLQFRAGQQQADPLDGVTLDSLQRESDDFRQWKRTWENIRITYRGGEEFLMAAGALWTTRASSVATASGDAFLDPLAMGVTRRRRRFLWQFEGEPDVKYVSVWERAFFVNYFSSVMNYFRHWLFSKPAAIRPTPQRVLDKATGENVTVVPDAPAWWTKFSRNCTGGGTDFHDFVRDAFLEALLCRRVGWLIGRPAFAQAVEASLEGQFVSQELAEELGLTDSLLTPYTAEEIVDWQEDASGELLWVVLKKRARVREFPAERRELEIYTYADRNRWRSWKVNRGAPGESGKPALEVIGDGQHEIGKVPFVMLQLPHDLWVANQILALCIDVFNRQVRLSTTMALCCFVQAVVESSDPSARSRIMGDGVILELKGSQGTTAAEKFYYVAPPTGPYELIAKSIDSTIQELYRAVHQLSLAVDTKAVSAVARSGTSKQEDRKSIEVILAAFGGYVREAQQRTCELISLVQGDGTEWSVEGFDDFDVSDLMDELQNAALVSTLQIHSPTFHREQEKSVATGRLMGHADPATKEAIEREINAHYDEEAEAASLGGPDVLPPFPEEPPTAAGAPPPPAEPGV